MQANLRSFKSVNERKKEELYDKIDKLEKERMGYLEADMNASAARIARKIEELKQKIQLLDLEKIKNELEIYKNVIKDYPFLKEEVSKLIKEQEKKKGE